MNELEKAFEFKTIIDLLNKRISNFIQGTEQNLAIKNVILMSHSTIEGLLNLLLSRYYLGEEKEKSDKDIVNHFWINILVEMNFLRKLRIIEDTRILEKEITDAVSKINNLRNDIAHYPHRVYKRKDKHLLYNGKHIFKDLGALRLFYRDFDMVLSKVRKIVMKQQ